MVFLFYKLILPTSGDNTGPYLGQFNTCNNDNNTARSALFYYATFVFSGVGGRKSIALPPMASMHGIGSTFYIIHDQGRPG